MSSTSVGSPVSASCRGSNVAELDRRDAMGMLDTLAVVSRTVTAREIAQPLVWIKANRDAARRIFEECNP